MRITNGIGYLKFVAAMGFAGAMAATVISLRIPQRYISTAVMRITTQSLMGRAHPGVVAVVVDRNPGMTPGTHLGDLPDDDADEDRDPRGQRVEGSDPAREDDDAEEHDDLREVRRHAHRHEEQGVLRVDDEPRHHHQAGGEEQQGDDDPDEGAHSSGQPVDDAQDDRGDEADDRGWAAAPCAGRRRIRPAAGRTRCASGWSQRLRSSVSGGRGRGSAGRPGAGVRRGGVRSPFPAYSPDLVKGITSAGDYSTSGGAR